MNARKVMGLIVCSFSFALMAFCATAYADALTPTSGASESGSFKVASSTVELDKVKARFPQAKTVLDATNSNLRAVLSTAANSASEASPVIVHATGAIQIRNTEVPANVILVGENDTSYAYYGTGAEGGANIFRMNGSIFGGTFKGGAAYYNILAKGSKGSSVNGYIEDVSIVSGKVYGICASTSASGIKITNCKVTGVGDCGIQATGGSTIDVITKCTISNCGESGIDVIKANIENISSNAISKCGGHGISTDTDTAGYNQQNSCRIGVISNNTISGCMFQGIYLEKKCTAASITGNKIFNNKRAGINVGAGGVAKGIAKNKIYGNAKSNIIASGANAKVTVGSGNALYKSKEHGLSASAGGTITVSGSNNKIYGNSKSGANAALVGSIVIKGKGTTIYDSGKSNIVASGNKSSVKITNAVESYNAKQHGVSASDGGKVSITGANCVVRDNAMSGVNVSGAKSSIAFSGKGMQIMGNKKYAISFNGGAKGAISNVKFSKTRGTYAVYVGPKSTFTYKNCNLTKSKKGANRVYTAK